MFLKIVGNSKSQLSFNGGQRRSYLRCARLQNFYSSLKKSPTYNVVFMPTAETVMTKSRTVGGWYNGDLTETGRIQSRCAGHILMRDGYSFDIGFCSVLKRDMGTLCHLFQEMGLWIDVRPHWRLNPRAMGDFTGQKWADLNNKYGINNVDDMRLNYHGTLPLMRPHHLYYENIKYDKRYVKVLLKKFMCLRETLPILQKRVLPYWNDVIGRQIRLNMKTVIVADDSVLRVLIKHLDNLSDDETMKLEIHKANPFVYTLDHNLQPIRGRSMQYIDKLVPIRLNDYVIACPT